MPRRAAAGRQRPHAVARHQARTARPVPPGAPAKRTPATQAKRAQTKGAQASASKAKGVQAKGVQGQASRPRASRPARPRPRAQGRSRPRVSRPRRRRGGPAPEGRGRDGPSRAHRAQTRTASRVGASGHPAGQRPKSVRLGTASPRRRMRVMVVAVLFVFSIFAAQLLRLQGFDASAVSADAKSSRTATVPIPAMRGRVLDSTGTVLASSIERRTVTVDQTAVVEYKKTVDGSTGRSACRERQPTSRPSSASRPSSSSPCSPAPPGTGSSRRTSRR